MAAVILDGKALAQRVRARLKIEALVVSQALGRPPGMAVILVGADPASQVYVRNKQVAAEKAGFASSVHELPADVAEEILLATIDTLNADPATDGILVQLPLPPQINPERVIHRIDPAKDIDGFHPINMGLLALGTPRFVACTPLGIREMLLDAGIETRGKRAVVLGRSNIVGKPMALLFLRKGAGGDATTTVCHTATPDAQALAREADILVVAMGRPEVVGPSWVKPGAAVIDVGIHRREDGSLCGDVRAEAVAQVAGHLSPVPGGVGPMTVAMLLHNTLEAARAQTRALRP